MKKLIFVFIAFLVSCSTSLTVEEPRSRMTAANAQLRAQVDPYFYLGTWRYSNPEHTRWNVLEMRFHFSAGELVATRYKKSNKTGEEKIVEMTAEELPGYLGDKFDIADDDTIEYSLHTNTAKFVRITDRQRMPETDARMMEVRQTLENWGDYGFKSLRVQVTEGIIKTLKSWRGEELSSDQLASLDLLEAFIGKYPQFAQAIGSHLDTLEGQRAQARLLGALEDLRKLAESGGKCTAAYSDLGDFYALVYGRDLCTDERLSESDRILAGIGLFAGSSKVIRDAKAASKGSGFEESLGDAQKMAEAMNVHGIKTASDMKNAARLGLEADAGDLNSFLASAAKNSSGLPLLFRADEALVHYDKHGERVMKLMGKTSYSLKQYLLDAHHVVKTGQYAKELNAYVKIQGGTGAAKVWFVGLTQGGQNLTTFHYKTLKEVKKQAPSLGWE